jgi:ADP-ribose pyrophosphatase YjhB (NUDIX family)
VSTPRLRVAARALVVDEDDRLLLVRMGSSEREIWVTPGGGLEAGESDEHALRRELLEETGLDSFELGPHVWTRTALFPFGDGRWDGELERVYLVRTRAFEPAPALSWERLRAEGMTAVRWWTLDELEATRVRLAPGDLCELVRGLLLDGPPAEPLDAGP